MKNKQKKQIKCKRNNFNLIKKTLFFKSEKVKNETITRFSEPAEVNYYTKPSLKEEEDLIFKKIKGSVLDVGCASGRVAFMLIKKQKVTDITAIDISKKMINKAIQEQKKHNIKNINFQNFDILNFKTNKKFDNVLCIFNVLSYFPSINEREKVIKKLVSLAKPQGRIFITINNKFYWRSLIKLIPLYLLSLLSFRKTSFGDSYNNPMFPGSKQILFQHFFSKSELKRTLKKFNLKHSLFFVGKLFNKEKSSLFEPTIILIIENSKKQ